MSAPKSLLLWQEHFSQLMLSKGGKLSERFTIYQEEYFGKLAAFLQSYYPSLPPLLGERLWLQKIAIPFTRESPSRNWNIGEWVEDLPAWLRNRAEGLSPLLLPLATLERLAIETVYAPPFRKPTPEEVCSGRLRIQSHVRFLLSSYPLMNLRQLLLQKKEISIEEGDEKWVVLSLDDTGQLLLTEMTPHEKAFIDAVDGRTLDEALPHLSEEVGNLLSHEIGNWTGKWIQYNLISSDLVPS